MMTRKEQFENIKKYCEKHRCYFCNEIKQTIKLTDEYWGIVYFICKECFLKGGENE